MILSYRARRYGNLDTLNSKIRPLQQILEIDGKKCEEEEEQEEEQEEQQEDPICVGCVYYHNYPLLVVKFLTTQKLIISR